MVTCSYASPPYLTLLISSPRWIKVAACSLSFTLLIEIPYISKKAPFPHKPFVLSTQIWLLHIIFLSGTILPFLFEQRYSITENCLPIQSHHAGRERTWDVVPEFMMITWSGCREHWSEEESPCIQLKSSGTVDKWHRNIQIVEANSSWEGAAWPSRESLRM